LNAPTCEWSSGNRFFMGSCDSAEIPAAYHPTVTPGRFVPSIAVVAGLRLGPDAWARLAAPATDWTGTTWLAEILVGDLAGVAGVLALGGGLWALSRSGCHPDSSGDSDPFCGAFETGLGAALGWTLGLTTGVYALGRHSVRGDGKWGWTFLGMLAGSAVAAVGGLAVYAVAPGSSQDRTSAAVYGGLALAATLPAGMAALFYRRSSSPPATPATVLSFSPGRGLSPSIPVPIARTSNGETSVSVGLVGGSF
jgi:hypothetical protein